MADLAERDADGVEALRSLALRSALPNEPGIHRATLDASMSNLSALIRTGRDLLAEGELIDAHRGFQEWDEDVADWLESAYLDSALSAQWSALAGSPLIIGGSYCDDPEVWEDFHKRVKTRLAWLGQVTDSLAPSAAIPPQFAQNPVARLFLSHASADIQLATYVREQLCAAVPGISIFLASLPGHIPVGADWLSTIKVELERADAYLVLLTASSVSRPWVWFETGAAWMSGRKLVTVTAAGLDSGSVPMPFSSLQILSLEVAVQADEVVRHLGGKLDDPERFSARLMEIARNSDIQYLEEAGWKGLELNGRYFCWDGPGLWGLPDRDAVLAPPGLLDALRAIQLIPSFGNRHRLTNHLAQGRKQVFETDRRSWRREVLDAGDEGQVLLIRPDATR